MVGELWDGVFSCEVVVVVLMKCGCDVKMAWLGWCGRTLTR